MPTSTMTEAPSALASLDPDDLRDEYARRGIDAWSDRRLVDEVAAVVSVPCLDPADSFVLHAPLELAARAALLPRVAPSGRELARLHILAIAAQYAAYEPLLEGPVVPDRNHEDPARRLIDAIAAGDPDAAVPAAAALAERGRDEVIALIDAVAGSTAAAGHAPIFLYHLRRGGDRSGPDPRLLPPLARELARQPDWRISWIEDRDDVRPTVGADVRDALAATPRMGIPGSTFIHPLMSQVDRSGSARDVLGDVVGAPSPAADREVLRAAARSMLVEPCDHAPYGWTHCLTMPQALLGLQGSSRDPARLLALAATEVVAFRAALATEELPTVTPPVSQPPAPDELATTGAGSHDAHVVKYVLACLDSCSLDPAESNLYLAAGQRLLDCWVERGGDPTDPLG